MFGSVFYSLYSDKWSLHKVKLSSLENNLKIFSDILSMAITLWSRKTPGVAQYERDIAVMNNKRKVDLFCEHRICLKLTK